MSFFVPGGFSPDDGFFTSLESTISSNPLLDFSHAADSQYLVLFNVVRIS